MPFQLSKLVWLSRVRQIDAIAYLSAIKIRLIVYSLNRTPSGFSRVTCDKEIARNFAWQIDLSQTSNTPTPLTVHTNPNSQRRDFWPQVSPRLPAFPPPITSTQTFDKRLLTVRGLLYSHLKNKLNFSLKFFSKIFLFFRFKSFLPEFRFVWFRECH